MSTIDSVIEYVATLDAGFPRAIRGAALDDLQQLEKAVGAPLPVEYRDFLLRMGESMDWLSIQQADFRIASVLSFYRRPAWKLPSHATLIARATLDAAYDLYLAGGRVVAFPPPEEDEGVDMGLLNPVAGSLAEMIGTRAYRQARLHRFPQGFRLYQNSPSPHAPEHAAQVLSQLGLVPLWFSNDWVATCDGPQGGAVASKGVNSVLVVDCASADPAFLATAKQNLTAALGMKTLEVAGIWKMG